MISMICIMGMVMLWVGIGYHLLPFWSVDNSITFLILSCGMFMIMLDLIDNEISEKCECLREW